MNLSYINNLIQQGKYSEVESCIDDVKSMSLRYSIKSKIQELNGSFEDALILAGKSIELAKNDSEIVDGFIAQAYAHWRLNQYQLGLNSIEKGLDLTSNIELNTMRMRLKGNLLNIQGLIYWKMNDVEKSHSSLNSSLTLREALSDFVDISYTLNNIGNVYLTSGDTEKTEIMYQKALELREKIGYLPPLAGSYNAMGRMLGSLNEYDGAREWYLKCLDTWIEVGNNQFIGKSLRFLGINAYNRNHMKEAIKYFSDSIDMFRSIGNITDIQFTKELIKAYGI